MRPETATRFPAVDGFGVEVMVRPDGQVPAVQHVVVQHVVVQHVVVQHGVLAQQPVVWQQIGWTSAPARTALIGTGQHGTM